SLARASLCARLSSSRWLSAGEPCCDRSMAEPLKHFFSRELVRRIGRSLAEVHPKFPLRSFVRDASRGLDELELKARAEQIAAAMRTHLPPRYPDAIRVIVRSLGPENDSDESGGAGMAPFFYLPHTLFVARHGLDHFELSMPAQHELTRRFTCEFSIRAFIEKHPERTFSLLERWARDANPHVRRLVSEGTRPRLPWGARVRFLDDHPERCLSLLELLKDDPSPMVRRSVANHLNDLSKTYPELAFATARRWLEGAPEPRR